MISSIVGGVSSISSFTSTSLGESYSSDNVPNVSGATVSLYKASGTIRLVRMSDGSVYQSNDSGLTFAPISLAGGDSVADFAVSGSNIALFLMRGPSYDRYLVLSTSTDSGLTYNESPATRFIYDSSIDSFLNGFIDGSNVVIVVGGGTYYSVCVTKDLGQTFSGIAELYANDQYRRLVSLAFSGRNL